MPYIRILVVENYSDWRRRIFLFLQARPDWQVICEASDGAEAVQKAEGLKPDLVLLDVGLPKLNAISSPISQDGKLLTATRFTSILMMPFFKTE